MAGSIQLRGKKQVLDAYDNIGVPVWAIYQHKSLLTKGENAEMLEQFLDLICENGTNAIYTLKTYEDFTKANQVKEKSEASGSLSFKFEDQDYEYPGNYRHDMNQGRISLDRRLAAIEEKLSGTGDAQPQTLEQAAIGLLANPSELATLITAVATLLKPNRQDLPASSVMNQQNYNRQGSAIGNTGPGSQQAETDSPDKLLERLQNAVSILEECDPELVRHLEKLAIIAKNNPAQFKMFTSMLDQM